MIGSFHHQFIPSVHPPPAACLLLLHGPGGNEYELLQLGQTLEPAAALLSPRGQAVEDGAASFFRRSDSDDLQRRAHELADWVNEAAGAYRIDRGRIAAVGYSDGADIASALMLLRPEILSSAILFRPMLVLEPEQLPDLSMTRVLIAAGRNDPGTGAGHIQRLAAVLSRADADVIVHWSESGHKLDDGDLRAASRWLMNPPVNAG